MAALCRSWGSPHLELLLADGARPPFARRFDTVLIDAPCSGLGTLARHPDIRWRAKPDDIPRHAQRQSTLLAALAPLVRPGGRLVYATCSLEDEETTAVVQDFLGQEPRLPAWEPFPTGRRPYCPPTASCAPSPNATPATASSRPCSRAARADCDSLSANGRRPRPHRSVDQQEPPSIPPAQRPPGARPCWPPPATSAILTMRSVLGAQDVVVPSLVGRGLGEAFALAAQQSLSVKVEGKRHDPHVPADRVAAQEPPGRVVPEVAPHRCGSG